MGGILVGTFELDVDGFWKFWPAKSIALGYWTEGDLRLIADLLEKENAEQTKALEEYFNQGIPAIKREDAGNGSSYPRSAGRSDISAGCSQDSIVPRLSQRSPSLWNLLRKWLGKGKD